MENEKLEKVTSLKEKKDFHPIWIYLVAQFVFSILLSIIIGVFLGIKIAITKESPDVISESQDMINSIVFIITNLLLFIVFAIMYFKKTKEDFKRLTKENVKLTIILSVISLIVNIILSVIFERLNISINNQDTINSMLNVLTIPIAILTMFLAPFIEEIVFRYSLGSLIKNNIVFVIVSSILFGVMHGIGISTIIYIVIGIFFSIIYIKTNKNIVASTIAHVINNLFAIILMLINLYFA